MSSQKSMAIHNFWHHNATKHNISGLCIITRNDCITNENVMIYIIWGTKINTKTFEPHLNNFINDVDFQNTRDKTSSYSLDLVWTFKLEWV